MTMNLKVLIIPWPMLDGQRNEILKQYCTSTGQLKVKELITEVVELEDYNKIYGNIGSSRSIASIPEIQRS